MNAYQIMEPYAQKELRHFKNDFLVHDKDILQDKKCDFLWILRTSGTYLFLNDFSIIDDPTEEKETIIKQIKYLADFYTKQLPHDTFKIFSYQFGNLVEVQITDITQIINKW